MYIEIEEFWKGSRIDLWELVYTVRLVVDPYRKPVLLCGNNILHAVLQYSFEYVFLNLLSVNCEFVIFRNNFRLFVVIEELVAVILDVVQEIRYEYKVWVIPHTPWIS